MKISLNRHFHLSALCLGTFVSLLLPTLSHGQTRVRTEPFFPDVPGYVTLKCDFHTHTVFSDGNVWPTVRAEEAWRQGLDAIAITDHIEYQPHKNEIPPNYGRSYEIARAHGESLKLMVIRGAEITRGEPPGHWNALFLKEVEPLNTKEYRDAVNAAVDQGAFVFWNHPGWKQPEQKSVWYAEQNELYEKGWLRGIEVVNGTDYDPIAHQWCLDKKLTLLGDSDVHDPLGLDYGLPPAERRPLTLVFAKERTQDAIKEALFARRTVVYCTNLLIGEAEFLQPLFERSIEILNPEIQLQGSSRTLVQIRNRSAVSYDLVLQGKVSDITVPAKVTLQAGKVSLLNVRATSDKLSGERLVSLPFRVQNLKTSPSEVLPVRLKLKVTFVPSS